MASVPFQIGQSNGLNEVFGQTLPVGSYVLLYIGGNFVEAYYDNTDIPGTYWYNADESVPFDGIGGDPSLPTVPPGVGFLLYNAGPVQTNTFAGTVAVQVGTSNVMSLTPYNYSFVGCAVPYAGAITNGNNSKGGPNLDVNLLPVGSYILFYQSGNFVEAYFDSTDIPGTYWYNADESANYVDPTTGGNTPNIAVGDGFLLYSAGTYNWITGL
jgi:hypothetical protein